MPAKIYFPDLNLTRPGALAGGSWQLRGLRPITVLFGKNGSGKSLLLRAWRDTQLETSHYVVPERTGTLEFQARFLDSQITQKQRREHTTNNFVTDYRQQVIARVQAYFMARGATRAETLSGNPADLEQLLSALLPDFSIELLGANPPYRLRRAENQNEVADVHQLSSGEAQILTLGLDILTIAAIWDIQNTSTRLLLVDEPDAHVHPDLQARFADFLVRVANQYNLQVVVATHSTTLLTALGQFGSQECGVIYLDRKSTVFVTQQFTNVLKELTACLGGHALMGPLFGVPLLLVEGDDDYRIWSQVPRHHVVSFAVIPCDGEEIYKYQATLEKVFVSLRDTSAKPAGYTLLDGDKPLPDSQSKPQTHIRFVRLKCHETENLFLTDEVLKLVGTDWVQAIAAIVAASGKHGKKAAKLANAANWNREQDDLKDVINEVSQAIDTKNVHWTQRVGVTIGRAKPTGQLAAFLGQDVVGALWP